MIWQSIPLCKIPIPALWSRFSSAVITGFHGPRWWIGWSETRLFSGRGKELSDFLKLDGDAFRLEDSHDCFGQFCGNRGRRLTAQTLLDGQGLLDEYRPQQGLTEIPLAFVGSTTTADHEFGVPFDVFDEPAPIFADRVMGHDAQLHQSVREPQR